VENFHRPAEAVFSPRFTTHFTTFSPSENHAQPPPFSKTPLKNTSKNAEIRRRRRRRFFF
jgi:hypothetical protein